MGSSEIIEAHQDALDRLCLFAVEGGSETEQAEIAYVLGTISATYRLLRDDKVGTDLFKAHQLLMAMLTLVDAEQRPEHVSPDTVVNCRNLVYPTIWDRLS